MRLRSFFFEKICLAIQCHQVKSTLLRETTKFDNKEDVKAFEESAVEDLRILLFNSMFDAKSEEGAAKEDVEQLSKYKFKRIGDGDKLDVETQGPCAGVMVECGTSSPIEYVLSIEDAECCICLSTYDHGAELREMPCGHHFHFTCVDKWLYINATCPLCKYNILKNGNQSSEV